MKRIIMAALMLVVASSFSVALSQSKKAMGNKAGLEKTVHAFFEFVKANDVAKIKSYYTADYTFTGPEGKIMGAEERLKVLQAAGNTFVSASDITVRTYGSSGVATGIATTKDSAGATGQSPIHSSVDVAGRTMAPGRESGNQDRIAIQFSLVETRQFT